MGKFEEKEKTVHRYVLHLIEEIKPFLCTLKEFFDMKHENWISLILIFP